MTVHKESTRMTGLTHGQLCYLQIPALDIEKSAEFYATVFGWQIEPTGSGFESPGVIGQWIDSRAPSSDAGPLASVANADYPARASGTVTTPPSARPAPAVRRPAVHRPAVHRAP